MRIITARWPGLALVLSLSSMIWLLIGWAKGPPSSSTSSLIQPMWISRPPIGVGREKKLLFVCSLWAILIFGKIWVHITLTLFIYWLFTDILFQLLDCPIFCIFWYFCVNIMCVCVLVKAWLLVGIDCREITKGIFSKWSKRASKGIRGSWPCLNLNHV